MEHDISIELSKVSKTYPEHGGRALQDVSIQIGRGEFVAIIGPSGCGKSTALRLMAGLEAQDAGEVRRPQETAMVFQSGALMPWLTVFENAAFGLRETGADEEKIRHVVEQELDALHMRESADMYPADLSGGQRQRVGIARALAVSPQVLLLDEPFSALDPKTTVELHADLLKLWRDKKITIVLVSHSIEEAVSLADRIILMRDGEVAKEFRITLPYPRHEQAAAFMHEYQQVRREFFK